MDDNWSWEKIRRFAAIRFGFGIKPEQNIKTLALNMKGKDLKRMLWFTCSYHCNRIYRDVFTFRIETVNVRVEQGELRGRKVTSVLGKTYYKFQGIPYAKPPVGPLRFKDPQPPDNWLGVRDALKHGNVCIHKDVITGMVKGSENCLFLNVYTPELAEKNVDFEGKAVLFWIHGGGFVLGSGNAEIYGPDFFINEDIILVTINYRLGALGFLCSGTDDVPGNAGLKDMVMALKWVQKNIAAFGGDPKKVTIFGESAGAGAVHYLMMSPLAKGLFKGAISQSGSAVCPWASNSKVVEATFKLGKAFGCDTNDPQVLMESLRKIPAKVIITRQNVALSQESVLECIPFEFRPCIESNHPEAFITKSPRELLNGPICSDVPYMTGVNEMEGMIMLKTIIDKRPPAAEIDEDFQRVVPCFLNLKYNSEKRKEVANKIRDFYFKGKSFNKSTYKEYIDLQTDTQFAEGFYTTTISWLKHMKSPIYNYLFKFEGDWNLFKKVLNIPNVSGCAHADEIFYLFHVPILGQDVNPNRKEMKVTKRMVRLWCNFAKYGNPTPDQSDDLLNNMVWPRVREGSNPHLVVDDEISISTEGIMKERMQFWDKIKSECGVRQ